MLAAITLEGVVFAVLVAAGLIVLGTLVVLVFKVWEIGKQVEPLHDVTKRLESNIARVAEATGVVLPMNEESD